MEKTGVIFEMTETFTLENMFAMELHKHTDVLNEIVTSAIKEIAIEKVGLFLVIKQARKKKRIFFLFKEKACLFWYLLCLNKKVLFVLEIEFLPQLNILIVLIVSLSTYLLKK